jgi:large repetitive protein
VKTNVWRASARGAFGLLIAVGAYSAVASAGAGSSTAPPARVEAAPLNGTGYASLTPARLLDTRPGLTTTDGQFLGGGAIGAGQTLVLKVTGRGGVPSTGVDAVVLVVTAAEQSMPSFLTVFPTGSPRPATSNLNPTPGIITPNTVIAKVGTNGEISIYNNSGAVHVVADVHGWFPSGSGYTPLVPARLMDTRPGNSTIDGQALGGGVLPAGGSVDLTVTDRGGVPASGVGAVVLNVTAVDQTTTSFVTVYPAGSTRPTASNLNPTPGIIATNVVVANVGTNGEVTIYNNSGTVNLVVDVQGWFAQSPAFTPVGPARLVDTRAGSTTIDGVDAGGGAVGPTGLLTVKVTGRAGLPATGVGAVAVNVTSVNPTHSSFLTVFPTGNPRPTASVLNPTPGLIASNMVIAKVGPTGEISIYNNQGSLDVIVDIAGWFPSDVQAVDDAATVDEDSAATAVDVLSNDVDNDGQPVTIASAAQPAHGTVVLTGGTPGARTGLTYTPVADYCGPDTFTYTLNGGFTATVDTTVTCIPDPPIAVSNVATVSEDAAATTIDVLANDIDVDGGPQSIASVTQPANGTVVITNAGADVTYQPNADYCNDQGGTPDTFTYTLAPGDSSAPVPVVVTCVNDAPGFTAGADQLVPLNGGAQTFAGWATNISAGPANEAGQVVDFIVTNDANALFSAQPAVSASGTLSFTPASGVSGAATVSVAIHDNGGTANGGVDTSAVQTFTITVNATPTAIAQSRTTNEDTPVLITLSGSDDDGDALTFSIVTPPTAGSVGTPSAATCVGTPSSCTATVLYTPNLDANGPHSFTFRVNDGSGNSAPATVDVNVTAVNDAPTFVAGPDQTVLEDSGAQTVTTWSTSISAGAINESGQVLTFNVTNDNNALFSAQPAVSPAGTLTFTPAADASGSATVSVALSDNGGTVNGGVDTSSTLTFAITVTPVNDAPSFTAGPDQTVAEDAGPQTANPWATAISAGSNEGGQTLTFTVTNDNNPLFNAQPAVNSSGVLTFTSAADASGSATVSVTLTDSGGTANGGVDSSGTQTFTITVTAVDDSPVAVADSATVSEDSGATAVDVMANDTDVDAGPRSVAAVTQPANGTVVITGGGTGLSYSPNANYCNTPPGPTPDTFTYTLTPGGSVATVSVAVTCVDDNPVAVNDAATVSEDSGASAVAVLANDTDIDGGPRSVTSVTQPANGTVVITGGGTGLSYSPNANYCNTPPGTTPDTFTYTLNPGGSSAIVSVAVTCVDDPPVAVNDSATVLEDAVGAGIDVLANDTDIDGGPKSVTSVTQPANGTVVVTGGGTGLSYSPSPNYCNDPPGTTPDTFTYTLTPGGSVATVSVTVTCVNDAPTGTADSFSGTSRGIGNTQLVVNDPVDAAPSPAGPHKTVTGTILGNDSDIDGPGPLVAIAGTFATNDGGSVVVETDGDFTFTPKTGTSCTDLSDSFNYTVSDQATPVAGTSSGTVTITLADCIWYVDDAAAAGGDGSSALPFNTLVGVNGAGGSGDSDSVNDTILVDDGTYAGGLPLENGQKLSGQRNGLVVSDGGAGTVILVAPGGANTVIAGGVVLGSGNNVQGIHFGNSAGFSLSGSAVGTATVDTITSGAVTNATGGGVSISGGTLTAAFTSLSSTGGVNGISLAGLSGSFTASGGAIVDPSGADVAIGAGTIDVTYDGTITDDLGSLVTVSGATGGTKDFNGLITDGNDGDGSGISLTGNTGATVRFDGGVVLSTGSNAAFTATGGGTANVTDPAGVTSNTITTTSGTGLNVTGTTIGAGGLTFERISVNGATNGIVLNNTGSTAGLTVTGTGSAGSGGTIQNTTGHGISLTSTRNVSLTRMNLQSTGGSGINGTGVTNFQITDSTINAAGNAVTEGAITFNNNGTPLVGNNISGTLTILRNTITSSFDDAIDVESNDGAVTDAQISNNVITNTGPAGRAINIVGTGTASTKFDLGNADIDNNTITNANTGIQVNISNANAAGPGATAGIPGNAANQVSITGNSVTVKAGGTQAVIVSVSGANSASRSRANVNISDNPSLNGANNGIVGVGGLSSGIVLGIGNNGYSTMVTTINNNVVDANHNAQAFGSGGISGGNGIVNSSAETPDLTLTVTGNTVRDTDGNGILLVGRGAAGIAKMKITGNNVAAPQGGVRPGIRVDAGNNAVSNDTVCLNISGNTSAGSGGAEGIGIRKQGINPAVNVFGIQGVTPASPTNLQAETFIESQNTSGAFVINGDGFVSCNTAPL